MSETVTIEQKKEFLRWFLKRYQMKRRECKWILNYLLSHDDLLENLHFVEDVLYTPRSMMISVDGGQGTPFQFHKDGTNSANAETAFHDVRLNPKAELYLQLNFPNNTAIEYLSVLEDNPHAQSYSIKNTNDAVFVEDFIAHIRKLSETEKRNRLIDEALDTGNNAWFMELTSQAVSV